MAMRRRGIDRYLDMEQAEAWIKRNVALGATFYVATSVYAFDGVITGFWSGEEMMAKRGILKRLDTLGVIEVENVFWRGARCIRRR